MQAFQRLRHPVQIGPVLQRARIQLQDGYINQ